MSARRRNRFGLRLKELLPDLAKQIEIHHASLDRSVRIEVEDRLKNGELRAVVCSTSLEMGIDIGAVDLVVMVATPKGVSRAIQRIGRSGHSLNQSSHGVLVATNINDLVEATATALLVRQRALDPIRIMEKPNDVLAQHIVGMAALAPIAADDAFAIVRRAYPYRELERDRIRSHPRVSRPAAALRFGGNTPAFRQDRDRADGVISLAHPRVTREFLRQYRHDRFRRLRRVFCSAGAGSDRSKKASSSNCRSAISLSLAAASSG